MNIEKYVESVVNSNPLLVIGSGSSASAGISGMGALGNFLKDNIINLSATDSLEWEKVIKSLNNGMTLELAMQQANIGELLTDIIVENTWYCIAKDESIPLLKIALEQDIVGFIRYFEKFRHSTNSVINIITTNYDHIIEWSAAASDWLVWDGFDVGVISKPISSNFINQRMTRIATKGVGKVVYEILPHIRLFKPHGSLSWFKKKDGTFIKLSGVNWSDYENFKKEGLKPVIVTPGIGKYLQTHFEPFNNVIAEMNSSIRSTNALIFYGFGFNDIHIQSAFNTKLTDISVPKIILSMKLTDSFHQHRNSGLIKNYLAIEKNDQGSLIFSDVVEEGNIDNSDIWSFNGLLNLAWGGINVS